MGLDYLLATPFRYAPYPHGSRFRRARQRQGCFYGSERVETAVAEAAFYYLTFFLASPGTPVPRNPSGAYSLSGTYQDFDGCRSDHTTARARPQTLD